ncbi:FecR domain-containing protein [Arcicella aquatica]|uniref:FecR domain-containing protein n=1 Tax=Arcicella aquatica TaxID=217141 RepID=A0ABU5QKV9_9BACT|nr:FecR domain-containing protein [Arcicella aquatica]MEA5257701.1 FecR domain-containing protein [Arcicella aquatica]
MTTLSKNMLFEHFAGRTSPLQKKMIADWLNNPENKEVYYKWLEEYENEYPQILADKDKAKAFFFQKIYSESDIDVQEALESQYDAIEEKSIWQMAWFKWTSAAVILMFSGLALYFQRDHLIYQVYQTAYGETQSISLPDGSNVTLNANSTLKLKRFSFKNEATREVFLDGEAEFSVKHTINNQKFIVKTSQKLEVEVLGTEFSVFARNRGSKVVLSKGKVKVNFLNGTEKRFIMMKPGDLVSLDKMGKSEIKAVKNVNSYTAWKVHRFVFDDTSLEEISYQIAEMFGVQIKMNSQELANRTVTGTFSADKADDLISILQELLNLQYQKNSDGTVVLSEIDE